MVIGKGEKIHVIERRYFPEDVRRHFCAEVIDFSEHLIRAWGYIWVFGNKTNQFVKEAERRVRLFCLGDRLTINILPPEADLNNIQYVYDKEKGYMATDGKTFSLNITEFSVIR